MNTEKTNREELTATAGGTRRAVKIVVSVLLLLHLVAIFSAPASSNGSPLFQSFVWFFRPYLEAAYLNHGYQFFAPEPGPSHLIEYELEFDDGRPAETGVFPDLSRYKPRLHYHRYFMMTEFANMLFMRERLFENVDVDSDEEVIAAGQMVEPPVVDFTRPAKAAASENSGDGTKETASAEAVPVPRSLAEIYARSYAAHLLKENDDATGVTIRLVRHFLPTADDVRKGMKLDDPKLYARLYVLRLSRDEL